MSGLALRPMRAADVEAVVELIAAHQPDDGPPARDYFEYLFGGGSWFAGDVHHVVVEPPGDRPLAVGGYGRKPLAARGIVWVRWLYAAPGYRGRGLGRLLMGRILDDVRALGARKLYLDTTSGPAYARARAVYEHYGFVLEGRLTDYHGDGEDKLIYALALAG